jgi:hypothetical protein
MATRKVSQSNSHDKSHGQNGDGAGEVPLPTTAEAPAIDIRFESHGSIVLIRGVSDAGRTWLDENVGNDETQYFGTAIAAEPRYCVPIVEGARSAGLVVR